MIPTPRDAIEIPMRGLTSSSIDVFAPTRSVITDMIMVQFISIIVTFFALLLFKGQTLSSTDVSLALVGIFSASMMLGTIYSRLTRGWPFPHRTLHAWKWCFNAHDTTTWTTYICSFHKQWASVTNRKTASIFCFCDTLAFDNIRTRLNEFTRNPFEASRHGWTLTLSLKRIISNAALTAAWPERSVSQNVPVHFVNIRVVMS